MRWFIRLRFPRSLNTRHKSWSGTVAICFASPHFLARNTDFSARRRTTWWNGKVTSIRVCTSRFTVFTATIANRLRKCWKAWMFCWSIFKMSGRVTTLLFGRCISAMRACERCGIAVVVLDRPNPINGVTTEGPVLDPNYKSFVGMHPIPVRHGRTIGELAQQFRDEAFPKCELSVLPMKNWERAMWFDQTGLPWVMPSPNMPTLETATVYPGMCLFEGTNISEGRGTTRPFEIFGAPFIDAEKLCTELKHKSCPAFSFARTIFSRPSKNLPVNFAPARKFM